MSGRRVLPSWTVILGDEHVHVRLTVEGKVWVDLPEDDQTGHPRVDVIEEMTPEEATDLAEALTLASLAAQERKP